MIRCLLLACFFIAAVGSERVHAQSCTDTLVMYYSPEFVEPEASFCIDFKVKNFDCLVAFHFDMVWDPASVDFTDVRGFGIPGLTAGIFNLKFRRVPIISNTSLSPEAYSMVLIAEIALRKRLLPT